MLPKLIGSFKVDEGRVLECSRNAIVVILNQDCAAHTTCATCGGMRSCAQTASSGIITVTGEHLPDCSPGMRARVSHFILNKTFAAFLVFIFPLLCAVAAMLAGQIFTGETTESVRTVVTGGVGFTGGFMLTVLIDRVIKRHIPAPGVISVF